MVSLGVVALLGLVAYTLSAPESRPIDVSEKATHIENAETETQHTPIIEDLQKKIEENDNAGFKKSVKEILESAAAAGHLERGFVSDLINSTLSGVQLGLSIGNKNGTSNQLCIKLGNIALGGCRRTAALVKETSSDNNRTDIPEDETRFRGSVRKARRSRLLDFIFRLAQFITDLKNNLNQY